MKTKLLGLIVLGVLTLDGVDATLDRIASRAVETSSDRVLIRREGRVILDHDARRVDAPIEAMSATKSVVALAIGLAIEDGHIPGVDTPVHRFFQEWSLDERRTITVRHLLNHTSGLEANRTTQDIYASSDFVAYALAARPIHPPGTHFFYNNRAVNLLPGIVERATGERMDRYLDERLFRPLGIGPAAWSWSLDEAGNPHGMAGLQIRAEALARIGELVLDGGLLEGRRLVSREWIDLMLAQGQELESSCGFLWWRRGHPATAFAAEGYLGQYLVVIPHKRIVAVRQIHFENAGEGTRFDDFVNLLLELP